MMFQLSDSLPLLRLSDQPVFRLWEITSAHELGMAIVGWLDARLVVRSVRGRKMRTVTHLYDEFAAALQFPGYFGENWAAFDECLTDLEWLPDGAGYVIVITEPLLVLDDSPADFGVLVRILKSAIEHWATPIEDGEWWDRPAVPFTVVLATGKSSADSVRQHWADAGALLAGLA